jgi:tRNA A-37 threonylcarbamoyl transferase component Bud32
MELLDKEVISQVLNNNNLIISPIIRKGEVNRVYNVKHKTDNYIFRLNSEKELPRFKKEAWCCKEASYIGIPQPQLVSMGVKNKTAYMMLDFIEGQNGKDINENKDYIWKIIGTYAKKLNSILTKGFGESMISPGTFDDDWSRYLIYNIDSLNPNDKLLELNVITLGQSQFIKEIFSQLKKKSFRFGLIHGDLSLENVIINNDKVTLIDWGVAESTIVPHMEIVDLLQNQLSDTSLLFNSFLQGYGMDRNEYESIKPEIEVFTLLQAIDKLRWAIDRKPEMINEFSAKVKALIS